MTMNSSLSTEILIVGRTGNGKSTLANTIIQREAFKTSCDTQSETIEAKYDYTLFRGREIKVVDTPGLGDTRRDNAADLQQFLVAIRVAIASSPSGYHVILYVIRFGIRYEKEDVKAVKKLKQFFGTHFIRDHCILVLTHGDNFESEPEIKKGKVTFEDWVRRQQEPNFRELLAECGSRVLLFNNRAEDDVRKQEQMAKLLQTIDELNTNGRRYTNSDFKAAESERERLFKSLQMPYLTEELIKEIGLIIFSLNKIKMVPGDMAELNQLSQRAGNLLLKIKEVDKGTGQLNVSIKTVSDTISTVQQHIDVINTLKRLGDEKINYQDLLTKHELELYNYKKQLKPEMKNVLKKKEEEVKWLRKKIEQIEGEENEHKKKASREKDENGEMKLKRKQEFDRLRKNMETALGKAEDIKNKRAEERSRIRQSTLELNEMKEKIEKDEIKSKRDVSEAKNRASHMEKEYQDLKQEELKRQGIFASLLNFISNLPIIRSIVSFFKN